jgi:hypothetical protein
MVDFPKPTQIKFVALSETLPAYAGDFRAIGKVLLTGRSGRDHPSRANRSIIIVTRIMVCDPRTLRLEPD